MTTLSTHVLDAVTGEPARDLTVVLDGSTTGSTTGSTDTDGRLRFEADLAPGTHRLTFATGAWFAAQGRDAFHPEVTVAFEVEPERDHLHVPLLLSPYSYTTYRGS